MSSDPQYVMAIDQGTTSTRAIIFDHAGQIIARGQMEHDQIFPQPGWVEHDPLQLWTNVREAVALALSSGDIAARSIAAIGITNQRETAVVWDRHTGQPVYNAIVWQDTRTQTIVNHFGINVGAQLLRDRTGLPLSTYFAGPKVSWILDHVDGARHRAESGDLLMGTIDTWILWNLTGGPRGGVHATDVTNASRTLLMNIDTLDWNPELCAALQIPTSMLPQIRSSAEIYGRGRPDGLLNGVPVAGILGDQQAATFGQACFQPGAVKNTYGTGNFLILNTGTTLVRSNHGLLTTICYQLGDTAPVYALEGSIAVTGSLVQWFRDNLGLITDASEIETQARQVDDNGGAYIVPAFSGLYAPHWRPDARGAIVGLTRYVKKPHLCRAVLEAVAHQTCDVVEAMNADAGTQLTELKVDGGMTANSLLLQIQANLLDADVITPQVTETTALGAAYTAGLAVGYWRDQTEIGHNWAEDHRWAATMEPALRATARSTWNKAVDRTLAWVST